jgi:hypothetical protein
LTYETLVEFMLFNDPPTTEGFCVDYLELPCEEWDGSITGIVEDFNVPPRCG